MNFGKDIKTQMEALNALQNGMEDFAKRVPGLLTPFIEEQRKLMVPKSKKDITVNGKPCSMSLLTDGRIVINLGTMDDAQKLYEDTNVIDKQFYESAINELKEDIAKLEAEINKKWWQKIFK